MQKFVNVEAVNIRSEPAVAPDTLRGTLVLGQQVDLLGDGPEDWHHVLAEVGGQQIQGFCAATLPVNKVNWSPPEQPTLRAPASPGREALVRAAIAQWLRFDKGQGKETDEPFSSFIGDMWRAFGKKLTGRNTEVPWSAVAISLMVRNAAKEAPGYEKFPESIGHARYMWESIRKGASSDPEAPFWGVRIATARPQVGDIIGSWRERPFSFEQYMAATRNPEMPSHTDIVVAVGPELVWAIGGNVQNSVFATGYQLNAQGFLTANQRFIKQPPRPPRLVGEAIVLMTNQVNQD